MTQRNKKGRNQLFNEEMKTIYLDSDDESDEETFRIGQVIRQPPMIEIPADSSIVIEVDSQDDIQNITKPPDPSIDLVKRSNLSEFARKFVEKYFPDKQARDEFREYFITLFCNIYLRSPTSRRCPELRFDTLRVNPPLLAPREEKLFKRLKGFITPCKVDLSQANVLYSVEKRIYKRYRRRCPLSRESMQFILPETLAKMTLDYVRHIVPNVDLILKQAKQHSGIKAREQSIKKVVDNLFELLDELTPEKQTQTPDQEEEEQVQGVPVIDVECELDALTHGPNTIEMNRNVNPPEETPKIYRPPPQRLEILSDRFKSTLHRLSEERIIKMLLTEDRLEFLVEIETPLGWREIMIHGEDIQRFLNIPTDIWKRVSDILGEIYKLKSDGKLTANTELLKAFARSFSTKLLMYKMPKINAPKRFYTILECDVNGDNQIEIESLPSSST
ncbi:uncharacterized protein LOC132262447 [Phlebotomus argentipes]|uniref:uncharacterized protein LOC132262447 n=1 Tax=Phlebotomus argentipes TaxID=94469 RepID=UPI0028930B80|nr:uncharacterized protein LOC132262447 [Phlebotomus argentipes]